MKETPVPYDLCARRWRMEAWNPRLAEVKGRNSREPRKQALKGEMIGETGELIWSILGSWEVSLELGKWSLAEQTSSHIKLLTYLFY